MTQKVASTESCAKIGELNIGTDRGDGGWDWVGSKMLRESRVDGVVRDVFSRCAKYAKVLTSLLKGLQLIQKIQGAQQEDDVPRRVACAVMLATSP